MSQYQITTYNDPLIFAVCSYLVSRINNMSNNALLHVSKHSESEIFLIMKTKVEFLSFIEFWIS